MSVTDGSRGSNAEETDRKSVPTRCVYEFKRYFGVESVTVTDAHGEPCEVNVSGNHYTAAYNYDDGRLAEELEARVIQVVWRLSCYMTNDYSQYSMDKDMVKDSQAYKYVHGFDSDWIATHRSYTKKDNTKGQETQFLNVLVRPGRKWASQQVVTKGAFLRVIGHLENNGYRAEDGSWKGGMEINADKITVLKAREDGKVENTETGEVEQVEEAVEVSES